MSVEQKHPEAAPRHVPPHDQYPDLDDDDDDPAAGDNALDDFRFTHLVIAVLLTLAVLLVKGVIVAELFNFVAPRVRGSAGATPIRWTTGVAIAILADILF